MLTNRLDRYIFKQFWSTLFFACFAFVGIFWLGKAVGLIEQVILRGESLATFFRLSVLLVPSILIFMLPLATLTASIFCFNRFAGDAELLVQQGGGRHPIRPIKPILISGLIISIFLSFVTFFLAPYSERKLADSFHEIEQNFTRNIVLAKNFFSPRQGVVVFANESLETGEMLDIFIDDRRDKTAIRQYFADKAIYIRDENGSRIALIDGEFFETNPDNSDVAVGQFDRLEVDFGEFGKTANRTRFLITERPTGYLMENLHQNSGQINADNLSELANRAGFALLGWAMAAIGAIGFLATPFSRSGYSKVILKASLVGIFMEAIMISARETIRGNVALAFIIAIPSLLALAIIFWNKRQVERPAG